MAELVQPAAFSGSEARGADSDYGHQIINKVIWRIVPFLMLLFVVNLIDRINLSFAALEMNKDLGFTPEVYGFAAGIFFIGYFLFEIPSNVILARVGAPIWICRIMVTWGIISAAMAFTNSSTTFYILRFLLGLAEAGFTPGIFYYLGFWVPSAQRGKVLGTYLMASPGTTVIAAPLSTYLLSFDGIFGLHGWQFMFLAEGIPAIILGVITLFYMTRRPADATWLQTEERAWLEKVVADDNAQAVRVGYQDIWRAMFSGRVLLINALYFCTVIGIYGVGLWLPTIVKTFGLSNMAVGWAVSGPYLLATITMAIWTRHSDRAGERRWHLAVPAFVATAAFIASALIGTQVTALIPLAIAAAGIYAVLPLIWTLPNKFLTGMAAAGGIAFINSVGNLGGFVGPYIVGYIREATGSFTWALMALSLGMFLAGICAVALPSGLHRK
jgi:MFS transporter, ACS family, tartrate transporter